MLYLMYSMLFAGSFDIGFLYLELSMDTYKYGSDPSPLIKTVNGRRLHIDSMVDYKLYGRVGNRLLTWDSLGHCISTTCKKGDNLTWSNIWKDLP